MSDPHMTENTPVAHQSVAVHRQERPRTATGGLTAAQRRGRRRSTERASSPGHFRPRTPPESCASSTQPTATSSVGGQSSQSTSALRQEQRPIVIANPVIYKRTNTAPTSSTPPTVSQKQEFGAKGRAPPIAIAIASPADDAARARATGGAGRGVCGADGPPSGVLAKTAIGRGQLTKANSDGGGALKPRSGSAESAVHPRIRLVPPGAPGSQGRGGGVGRAGRNHSATPAIHLEHRRTVHSPPVGSAGKGMQRPSQPVAQGNGLKGVGRPAGSPAPRAGPSQARPHGNFASLRGPSKQAARQGSTSKPLQKAPPQQQGSGKQPTAKPQSQPQLLTVGSSAPTQRSVSPGKVRSHTVAGPRPASPAVNRLTDSPTATPGTSKKEPLSPGRMPAHVHRRSASGDGLTATSSGDASLQGSPTTATSRRGSPTVSKKPAAKQGSPLTKRPSEDRPGPKTGPRSHRLGAGRAATMRGCTMDAVRLQEGRASNCPSGRGKGSRTASPEQMDSIPPARESIDPLAPPIPPRAEDETGSSLYADLSRRQSVLLEQLDRQWSDAYLFGEVSAASESEEEVEEEAQIVEEMESQMPSSDSSKVLLKELNIELPEAYTTMRKSRRSSVKPTDWEGWQRRVKRQTWEEWEIRLTPKPLMGMKAGNNADAIVSQLQARNEEEVDGRAVVPYWLMRWWLTKNTTNRPTISKHPLLELLLEDNMAVVSELAKVVKGNMLSNLSVALVRVFDGCAKVIPLIVHFVKSEVAETLHQSTLFRTNTITTKIMSAYAKIAGAPYLRKHIGPFVSALVERNVGVEIDQKKLASSDLLEGNLSVLLEKTQELLDVILGTVDEVPFMLRQICSCLSSIVRDKFPEAEHFSVAGFMFLRFLCPAIVAPDAFGVVKTPPSSATRRTLVLMSKVLQNLANGTEHAKEGYMQPTDTFVGSNLERMRRYFKHISDITRVPLDKVDVNFTIIPVPLVEESLTIIHRMIIKNIDMLKENLKRTEVTETVEYHTYDNLATVLLKSSMAIEQLKSGEQVLASSPLFKPYALLIDVLLANGCKVIGTLLQNKRSEMDRKLIAEELMIVVHTHGNALQFVKSLISREVAVAGSTTSSFSESSLGTWLIFGYFKLLVRDFITTYWRTTMESIMATNVSTEVDTTREAGVDTAQAVRNLEAVTDQLLEPLFEHALELPARLFLLCRHIQEHMEAKFRSVDTRFSAKLLCEKIFILAVTYPMLFHMTQDLPKFNARRTLVLASGIVRHTFLGGRFQEESLQPLNAIVEKHSPAAKKFLQCITAHSPHESPLLLPWTLQRTVLINIYGVLQKELLTLKAQLDGNTTIEHITYNIFDRLAAVIALYRYRLRVRTQKFSTNEYSDSVSKR